MLKLEFYLDRAGDRWIINRLEAAGENTIPAFTGSLDTTRLLIPDDYLKVLKIYNEAYAKYYNGTVLSDQKIYDGELKQMIMVQYAEQLGITIDAAELKASISTVQEIKDDNMTNLLELYRSRQEYNRRPILGR